MELKPLGNRVVVRRVENDEKTTSGLYIPDIAQEKPMEGVVLAAGPGAYNDKGERNPMHVSEGDRVVFGKWAGDEVTVDNEELLIITEDDIIGILK